MKFKYRTLLILAAIVGALSYFFGTSLTVTSAWLITMASQHPPVLVLSVAVVLVRFFGISRSIARYAERVLSHEAVFSRLADIRANLFDSAVSVLRSKSSELGRFTKMLVDDVERAEEYHLRVSLPYAMAWLSALGSIAIALSINRLLALEILIALLILGVLIPKSARKFLHRHTESLENKESELAELITQASQAISEAEVFGYGDRYKGDLSEVHKKLEKLEGRTWRISALLHACTIATIGLLIFAISISLYRLPDQPAVQIAMALFLPLVSFEAFTIWFPNLFASGRNFRAQENIRSITSNPVSGAISLAEPQELRLEKVSAYWVDPFAQQVSFIAQPGDVIEIRGPSGSGKSTLAAALFGFSKYEGSIKYGDIEISSLADTSHIFAGSLQSSHIFNTSIRENLRIASQTASDQDLLNVLADVELEDLSLDEVVGEFGRALSGGEEKRIAIARALLSNAPVIVLDEPTEHLDNGRSLRVAQKILARCAGKTLIVISHAPWPKSSLTLNLRRQ